METCEGCGRDYNPKTNQFCDKCETHAVEFVPEEHKIIYRDMLLKQEVEGYQFLDGRDNNNKYINMTKRRIRQ